MILVEGCCIYEKWFCFICKGMVRIVLGVLDSMFLEEVYIVFIGVNYIYVDWLCLDVMINCGELIKVSEYLEVF